MAGGTISIGREIEHRDAVRTNHKRKGMTVKAAIGRNPRLIAVHEGMVPVRQGSVLTCWIIMTAPADLLINARQKNRIVVGGGRDIAAVVHPGTNIIPEFLVDGPSPPCGRKSVKPGIKGNYRTPAVTGIALERIDNRIKNMTTETFRPLSQLLKFWAMTDAALVYIFVYERSTATIRGKIFGRIKIEQCIPVGRDPCRLMGFVRLRRIGIR